MLHGFRIFWQNICTKAEVWNVEHLCFSSSDLLTSGAWRIRESDHIRAPYTRISCWWVIMSAWQTNILFTSFMSAWPMQILFTKSNLGRNLTLFKTILILSSFFRIAWKECCVNTPVQRSENFALWHLRQTLSFVIIDMYLDVRLRTWIAFLNSSEMSSLWASNSKIILFKKAQEKLGNTYFPDW